jgi:putative membrane protein
MMVRDHSKANDELKQAASQLNIQPSTQLDQKHRELADRLSKLKGTEFDREYMTAMVQGHQEVLSKLQARTGHQGTSNSTASNTSSSTSNNNSASNTSSNPSSNSGRSASTTAASTGTGRSGEQAIDQWAAKTLPAVQQHLEKAKDLQQKVAK